MGSRADSSDSGHGSGLDWVAGTAVAVFVTNPFLLQESRAKWPMRMRKVLEDPTVTGIRASEEADL